MTRSLWLRSVVAKKTAAGLHGDEEEGSDTLQRSGQAPADHTGYRNGMVTV